ncbi:MAG TPA: hypothetical protein VIH58_12995 [Chthoniobacterales bacterium]
MDVRSLLIRTRLAARRIGRRAKVRLAKPPPPWAQLTVASFAFVAALTGAIFAGLNYFRSFKTAALVVDHFEDYQTKAPIPGVGEKNFHVLRMWAANYGQSSAKILNVAISPEFTTTLMTPEQETGRMDTSQKTRQASVQRQTWRSPMAKSTSFQLTPDFPMSFGRSSRPKSN